LGYDYVEVANCTMKVFSRSLMPLLIFRPRTLPNDVGTTLVDTALCCLLSAQSILMAHQKKEGIGTDGDD